MGRSTFQKLAVVCLISSTVPSATALSTALDAAQALGLLSRDASTCAEASEVQCTGSNLPSNFCCPASTKCIPLSNATSIICCPEGQDCQMIQPITCDITQQNATAHPQNPIKTTNLTATLPTCGSECCPLGYTCQNGNQCVIDPTPSASTTSSTSASASIVPTLVPIVTAPANSGNATVEAHCDAFPAKAVVAGFFPGMILGALLAALAFCLLRRTKKNRQSGDFGHVSATVSDPIYQPQQTAMRSDFLRRGSASDQRSSKVRSLFSKSSPITPTPKQKQRDGIGRSIKPEIKKEPSTESINIFAPPNLRPGSNMTRKTTFSDMMENAGFPKNAPYAIVEGERLRRNG